ncbi:Protein CBG24862 [Caenorhabditis briggsae]|uniref:Protein CBG24862 n=1 Tax=Caenorhabditis briggsae TaxID=6238 RepID=A8WLM8_CAEBR|nr:Protein CBG24862 [Caenorhabditis briggsae]CAP21374.2 Protein CBG24862 [Caenorhabditis briggsae]
MEKSSYEESIENVQNVLMRLENKTFLIHFVLNLLSIVINFFHLIVLTQKTMRTSSINILISGIAICDLFTMFTWVYKYLSLADLEYPECITATSLIKIYMDVTSWSSQYHFRRTTCWLGIVMASIRYVIMSRISDVRHFKWADPKMGYILIVIVFGSSGVLTVIWQWECQVVENRNYSLVANCAEHQEINGNYKFSVTLRPFANLGHYVIVRTYFILDATLSNFIPCIAFPTLTFLLFRQIQKINETRETIRRNSTTTEDNEEKYVLSVKLIVFITINFFIAEAPIGTIAILKTFLERTDKLFQYRETLKSVLGGKRKSVISVQPRLSSFVSTPAIHIAHHLHRANFICSFISVIINIFHFIILSRKSMRTSSTNVIMIGIAISDISTMLSTIYKHYFLVDVESPECVTASVRYKIYLDLSAWTFQDHYRRCSSWLGVLMAIVRLFVMKTMPNSRYGNWSKPKTGCFFTLLVFCVSAMLSIFFVSRNQIVENRAFPLPLNCAEYQDINSRPPFSVILTPLFSSSNFLVLRIFTMFDAIVTKFIPCIAFPCFTVFLIRELRKFHNRVVMNGRKQSVVNGEKNDITTKLIVFMTFAFFIAEAPLGTIYLVKVFSNRDDEIL